MEGEWVLEEKLENLGRSAFHEKTLPPQSTSLVR